MCVTVISHTSSFTAHYDMLICPMHVSESITTSEGFADLSISQHFWIKYTAYHSLKWPEKVHQTFYGCRRLLGQIWKTWDSLISVWTGRIACLLADITKVNCNNLLMFILFKVVEEERITIIYCKHQKANMLLYACYTYAVHNKFCSRFVVVGQVHYRA